MLAEADSDAPSCSTASWRKKETFHPIYSNTARHRKALTPQQHPCSCLQVLEVGLRVGVYLQDCLQKWFRCIYSLLMYFSTFVFVCLWSVSASLWRWCFICVLTGQVPRGPPTTSLILPRRIIILYLCPPRVLFSPSSPLFLALSHRFATIFIYTAAVDCIVILSARESNQLQVMQCKSKPTLNIHTGRAKLGSPRRNLYLGLASRIGKKKQWQTADWKRFKII